MCALCSVGLAVQSALFPSSIKPMQEGGNLGGTASDKYTISLEKVGPQVCSRLGSHLPGKSQVVSRVSWLLKGNPFSNAVDSVAEVNPQSSVAINYWNTNSCSCTVLTSSSYLCI